MDTVLGAWHHFAAMAILLSASALFSAAETAFFSLSRADVREMETDGTLSSAWAVRLFRRPRRLLVSILLGNLAAALGFFSFAVDLTQIAARQGSHTLAVVVSAFSLFLLILLGEFLPKGIALQRPRRSARFLAAPLVVFEISILPVRYVLDHAVRLLSAVFSRKSGMSPSVTVEELKAYVRLSGATGEIPEGERAMAEDVIELSSIRVREVLVPRVDIVSVDVRGGDRAVLDAAREERVSKVVVHDTDRDRILGYVAVKDLLYRPEVPVRERIRKMPIVPETKTADSMLREFRSSGAAMALVVDEYGGTEGIVTPEDILEQVVGDILDEYDTDEGPVRRISPATFAVAGDLSAREWGDRFEEPLPDGKFDTVGGFVLERLDRLPKPGDSVRAGAFRLTVLRVRRGRVISLLVRRLPEEGP